MVLEPFFLITGTITVLGAYVGGVPGSMLVAGSVIINMRFIFWPAVFNYFTVGSVEQETFKYYQNVKLHRTYEHPVIQAFAGPKVDWIASHVALEGKSVLDVGGGNGYFSQFFMKVCSDTHVVDISDTQLQMNPLASEKRHLGSAYKLDFPDNSFDVVFASNLLHHLDRPEVAMKEFARVARDRVVIMEASNANPLMWLGACVAAHEFRSRLHSKSFVGKLITDQKLHILEHTYQGGMLLPNRSATWTLPFAMYKTLNPYLSYFQIFIASKRPVQLFRKSRKIL